MRNQYDVVFLTGDDSFAALTNVSDGCVALLQVSGNFMFDAADHRDFLGATLGAGIERKTVGDVLVQGETVGLVFAEISHMQTVT